MKRETTKRRDAQAANLRIRGVPYREIAEQLGFASAGAAHDAVSRSLKESVKAPLQQQREIQSARLDDLALATWKIIYGRHVVISGGQVVTIDGEPVPDPKPILAAVRTLIEIENRRSRLLGLDAPPKAQTMVITQDVVAAEIARLEAEISERSSRIDGFRPELGEGA